MPIEMTVTPEHYDGHDLEALADLPHYMGWIRQHFAEHLTGRVLEVGAGTGNFAAHYADSVEQAVLLEPAQNLFASLAERFADRPHVQPICGVLDEWAGRPASAGGHDGAPFDTAVMVNVLEHIADDRATVRQLAELLRPGGKLLIFVPALRWLYGSLDAEVQHCRRYTRSGLARVVERSGLEVLALRYFDAAGVLPWFVAGRILRQRHFSAGAARLYDRVVVPIVSRVERWARLPLGKNVVCIAQRPAAAPAVQRAA